MIDVSYFGLREWLTSDNFMGCTCAVHSYYYGIIGPLREWCIHARPLKHLCHPVIREQFTKNILGQLNRLPLASPLKWCLNFAEFDSLSIEKMSNAEHFEQAGTIQAMYNISPLENSLDQMLF